jgi:hypothetical protein
MDIDASIPAIPLVLLVSLATESLGDIVRLCSASEWLNGRIAVETASSYMQMQQTGQGTGEVTRS